MSKRSNKEQGYSPWGYCCDSFFPRVLRRGAGVRSPSAMVVQVELGRAHETRCGCLYKCSGLHPTDSGRTAERRPHLPYLYRRRVFEQGGSQNEFRGQYAVSLILSAFDMAVCLLTIRNILRYYRRLGSILRAHACVYSGTCK